MSHEREEQAISESIDCRRHVARYMLGELSFFIGLNNQMMSRYTNYKKFVLVMGLMGILSGTETVLAEEYQSGPQQSVMVELYTSEGCSSCPPAEEYLNTYRKHPDLWKTYFPMAFHVDYWDYLGWKDRFSEAAHSQRQRAYARHLQQRTVFTPAFFVNGQPWRPGWLRDKSPPASNRQGGVLSLKVAQQTLTAGYQGNSELSQALQLHVVVLGLGLNTKINAGENQGRSARHEFVVLVHTYSPGTQGNWQVRLPKFDRRDAGELALVAWVSRSDDPTPLQTAGGIWEPVTGK